MAIIGFPNPVNEVSARLVATGVVGMAAATIAFDLRWMTLVLAYGFVARVLSGPTLSPLGQLVTRVITPALPFEGKSVPGPPKRFAQGIGVGLGGVAADWLGSATHATSVAGAIGAALAAALALDMRRTPSSAAGAARSA
jgi:hypothetical protein